VTRLNQPTVNMVITNVKCETITDKISTDYHKHCYPHLLLNLFHLGFVRNIHRIGHSFCFLSSLFQSFYRLQKHKYTDSNSQIKSFVDELSKSNYSRSARANFFPDQPSPSSYGPGQARCHSRKMKPCSSSAYLKCYCTS